MTPNLNFGKFLTLLLFLSGLAAYLHVLHPVHHVTPHVPPKSAGTGAVHLEQGTPSHHQLSGPWQYISNKQKNKKIRAVNGNRECRGIRLAHWNAGSAH